MKQLIVLLLFSFQLLSAEDTLKVGVHTIGAIGSAIDFNKWVSYVSTMRDLVGKTVVAIKGTASEQKIPRGCRLIYVKDYNEAIGKVIEEEADAFIYDTYAL